MLPAFVSMPLGLAIAKCRRHPEAITTSTPLEQSSHSVDERRLKHKYALTALASVAINSDAHPLIEDGWDVGGRRNWS